MWTPLIQGDTTGVSETVPDAADEWVCERIIGQYLITGNTEPATNAFLHHRVYPGMSDTTSVALRDLTTADDAESDFLWHQVDPWASVNDALVWGTWGSTTNGYPDQRQFMGRMGHVDIRVNRRIRQGEALVWHTQIASAVAPGDSEFQLFLWLRMLVRTG